LAQAVGLLWPFADEGYRACRKSAFRIVIMPEHINLVDLDVPLMPSRFRLQWEPAQNAHVLLYPEGMVKLSDSAAQILKRVDGIASAATIIQDLERAFPGADLRSDVLDFLSIAHQRGWIIIQGR